MPHLLQSSLCCGLHAFSRNNTSRHQRFVMSVNALQIYTILDRGSSVTCNAERVGFCFGFGSKTQKFVKVNFIVFFFLFSWLLKFVKIEESCIFGKIWLKRLPDSCTLNTTNNYYNFINHNNHYSFFYF